MWRASLVLLAIAAGATASSTRARAGNEPGRTKYHMRQQLSDMRTIERMLVAGQLEDAKSVAFMLRPFGEAAAPDAARDFEIAVAALRSATALDEAIHAEVRVATACAHCHVKAQKVPQLKTPSHAPPDRPTIEHQMARHQWAVDR